MVVSQEKTVVSGAGCEWTWSWVQLVETTEELTRQPCTHSPSHHRGGENLVPRVPSSGRKPNVSLILEASDFHKSQIKQAILHCFSSSIQEYETQECSDCWMRENRCSVLSSEREWGWNNRKKVYSIIHALIQLSSSTQHIQSSFSFELSNDFNSPAVAGSCFTKVRFWGG